MMIRFVLCCFILFPCFSQSYLNDLDPDNARASIQKIRTKANVSVSDGLTYTAETFFVDHQRAIFKKTYSDRVITDGVDGQYTWQYDGSKEMEAQPMIRSITLGHQFHAILLMLLNKDRGQKAPNLYVSEAKDIDAKNLELRIRQNFEIDSDRYLKKIEFKFDDVDRTLYIDEDNRPIGMVFSPYPGYMITFSFLKWKSTNNINLPQRILINDGSRTFDYDYTSIEFDKGLMNDYRPPLEKQTQEQQIHRLHRQIMDDHLFERAVTVKQTKGDTMYVLSGGEMYRTAGDQNVKRFETMMGNRDYFIYDDLIKPMIRVSEDGTLAWAMVQIYAKGVRLNPDRTVKGPLEFTFAWVELYQKIDGRWTMFGNVSNAKPDVK